MKIDNDILPDDIMRMVLFLQPSKSLLRFKAVCKSWNTAISDRDFAKKHLQQSIRSKNRNIFLCAPLESKEFHVAKFENNHFQVETIGECPNPGKDYVCSGDGLVLFSTSSWDSLMLWNPFSKQKTMISCDHKFDLSKTTFGISRGPSFDDYKIVAECSYYYTVYSCKSGSWSEQRKFPTAIEATRKTAWHDAYWLERMRYDRLYGQGLFIDGFSFWIMVERAGRIPGIFYFDPRDEQFKKLRKPAELETGSKKKIVLGSLRGCLCLLHDITNLDTGGQFRVWMLKDNNVDDSSAWSELPIIKDVADIDGLVPGNAITPLFFTENNELVIRSRCADGGIGMINSLEKKFEKLDVSESPIFDHDSITVPCVDTIFFPMSIERNSDVMYQQQDEDECLPMEEKKVAENTKKKKKKKITCIDLEEST